MECRASPNADSNPGDPWKWLGAEAKHRFGLCENTVNVTDTEPHIFVWFVASNRRHCRQEFVHIWKQCKCSGYWGRAGKPEILAQLLICYMIYLTFCFLTVSLIVLPTYRVNLSEKRLFLAQRIVGIIWISRCFCDNNSKETRKPVLTTWCVPVRDKVWEHQRNGVTLLRILLSWKHTDFERRVTEQLYKEQGQII